MDMAIKLICNFSLSLISLPYSPILLREGLKKTIESVSMLIPPSDPTPPTLSAINNFFSRAVFVLFVMLGTL